MSKDEIREKVGGSSQLWRHRRSGRLVRVISLVGMNYEHLRLKGVGGNRTSKKQSEAFFKEYEKIS